MRRLNSINDIRRALAALYNALERGEIPEGKAKALAYISGQLRACIEASDLEERLRVIEEKVRITT